MKLKTYFSGTVEAAMERAREELGPDTMIVYSRRSDKENRHLGEYEVVFAIEEPTGKTEHVEPDTRLPELPSPAPDLRPGLSRDALGSLARVSVEVAELRRQMERISGAVNRGGTNSGSQSLEIRELVAALVDAGLEPLLAQEIVDAVQAGGAPRHNTLSLPQAVAAELSRRLATSETGEGPVRARRMIALAGPPGAGKTLTLVKLAYLLGLNARCPAQILSIDNLRIGAPDQLRTYAAILGIPFRFVETPSALSEALDDCPAKKVVLIDTPGYAPREIEDSVQIADLLAKRTDIEVHLVLSASAKTADLMRAVERYGQFQPDRLIFTRVDETVSYGSVLNTAIRSCLPISWLGTGQSVPEDLEPATKKRLLSLVLDEAAGAATAA
ncbi:MAG: hypothetical protein ABI693_18290 [Bryobacteraceae bacterium]